jgi:hypothetical protein
MISTRRARCLQKAQTSQLSNRSGKQAYFVRLLAAHPNVGPTEETFAFTVAQAELT